MLQALLCSGIGAARRHHFYDPEASCRPHMMSRGRGCVYPQKDAFGPVVEARRGRVSSRVPRAPYGWPVVVMLVEAAAAGGAAAVSHPRCIHLQDRLRHRAGVHIRHPPCPRLVVHRLLIGDVMMPKLRRLVPRRDSILLVGASGRLAANARTANRLPMLLSCPLFCPSKHLDVEVAVLAAVMCGLTRAGHVYVLVVGVLLRFFRGELVLRRFRR
mmetsp:Transcript_25297/g.63699  ORF Transcript_25297/g.63699 Transcript_25297/m.63699 type:complete len:215 (+) Transcript_25297:98-742(+)